MTWCHDKHIFPIHTSCAVPRTYLPSSREQTRFDSAFSQPLWVARRSSQQRSTPMAAAHVVFRIAVTPVSRAPILQTRPVGVRMQGDCSRGTYLFHGHRHLQRPTKPFSRLGKLVHARGEVGPRFWCVGARERDERGPAKSLHERRRHLEGAKVRRLD